MKMLKYSPNTAMLLGAMLSGGDVMALAKSMVEKQDANKQKEVTMSDECGCDLCQCFGEGECDRHTENCDHCNSGKDSNCCPWLEEI